MKGERGPIPLSSDPFGGKIKGVEVGGEKTVKCPKCGGSATFEQELSSEEHFCPHCKERILEQGEIGEAKGAA